MSRKRIPRQWLRMNIIGDDIEIIGVFTPIKTEFGWELAPSVSPEASPYFLINIKDHLIMTDGANLWVSVDNSCGLHDYVIDTCLPSPLQYDLYKHETIAIREAIKKWSKEQS